MLYVIFIILKYLILKVCKTYFSGYLQWENLVLPYPKYDNCFAEDTINIQSDTDDEKKDLSSRLRQFKNLNTFKKWVYLSYWPQ